MRLDAIGCDWVRLGAVGRDWAWLVAIGRRLQTTLRTLDTTTLRTSLSVVIQTTLRKTTIPTSLSVVLQTAHAHLIPRLPIMASRG